MSVPAVDIFLGSPSFTVFWITAIMAVAVVSILYRGGGANNRGRKQLQFKASSGRSQLLKNDRLSVLPDDILINILSFLTMKEAGRTSVLSKSWRHLWAYIPTLHFDSSKLIHEFQRRTKSPQEETPRYMHWVDQVVSSYKGPTIDEFRIRFDMRWLENSSCSIDNSIRFALEKKVKRLEVDLTRYTGAGQLARHTFNCSLLSSCNSLTSLELGCINITGEMLESVLCNCQTLEYLSVHRSSTLLSLKVTGRSLSLKALRIYYCTDIKQLEISAPNLVSVCYAGPKINVDFKSGMPKLADVYLGFDYANDLVKGFSDLSGYLSQIESLKLATPSPLKDIRISVEGSVFTRLGKLVLKVDPEWDDDLNRLELLLKACPVLHHFKLELALYEEDSKEREGLEKLKAYPHYHLKVVEIVGFHGYPIDLEIAAFLIESAVSLEKISFDSRNVRLIGTAFEFDELPKRKHAREQARRLHTKLKPGIKLEIF